MGNRIKEVRQKRKLSQGQLAEMVGISRPYLSDLENNKKEPGVMIAMRIAACLKVDVEDIFFESKNKKVNDD